MPASPNPNLQHSPLRSRYIYSDQSLLKDLKNVAARLGTRRLSEADYSRFGKYAPVTICRRFSSWTAALARVNLQPAFYKNAGATAVINDIRRVADKLKTNRLTLREYRAHGKYARRAICRLFGPWHLAATAAGQTTQWHHPLRPSQGPRTINLALRFKILTRDHFRCQSCGRSPATHPQLHLEVDHITPWSRGGHTHPDNLQTLCNHCNRGKSDSICAE
jgi:hypothetical protein